MLAGKLFASNFSISISNESDKEYKRLDIIISPVNFNANHGHVAIGGIEPYSMLKYEVEADELFIPLMFQGGLPGKNSNLKVQIIAVLKESPKKISAANGELDLVMNLAHKEFNSILNKKNWKLICCHKGIGLQVPDMEITIDEAGHIDASFF